MNDLVTLLVSYDTKVKKKTKAGITPCKNYCPNKTVTMTITMTIINSYNLCDSFFL